MLGRNAKHWHLHTAFEGKGNRTDTFASSDLSLRLFVGFLFDQFNKVARHDEVIHFPCARKASSKLTQHSPWSQKSMASSKRFAQLDHAQLSVNQCSFTLAKRTALALLLSSQQCYPLLPRPLPGVFDLFASTSLVGLPMASHFLGGALSSAIFRRPAGPDDLPTRRRVVFLGGGGEGGKEQLAITSAKKEAFKAQARRSARRGRRVEVFAVGRGVFFGNVGRVWLGEGRKFQVLDEVDSNQRVPNLLLLGLG